MAEPSRASLSLPQSLERSLGPPAASGFLCTLASPPGQGTLPQTQQILTSDKHPHVYPCSVGLTSRYHQLHSLCSTRARFTLATKRGTCEPKEKDGTTPETYCRGGWGRGPPALLFYVTYL